MPVELKSTKKTLKRGFGLLEFLIAMGLFTVVAVSGVTFVLSGYSMDRLAAEESDAMLFAQEGIEAVKSVKAKNWSSIAIGTYGVDSSSGEWVLVPGPDIDGKYSRTITISAVYRDTNGNISPTGTLDSNVYKASVLVDWDFTNARNNEVALETYLTNWVNGFEAATSVLGDWSLPSIQTNLNLARNVDGYELVHRGDYVYMIRRGSTSGNEFDVIDISDPQNPLLLDTLALSDAVEDLFVDGDYAYVATDGDTRELLVIDISNPSNVSLVEDYNASGSGNAYDVAKSGDYVYLTRASNLTVVNATDPTWVSLTRSITLSGNIYCIQIIGNYAYVGSSTNNMEMIVLNISNPSTTSQVATLDLPGSADTWSIDGEGNTIFVGRSDGNIDIVNITDPLHPVRISSYDTGNSTVYSLDYSATEKLLFVGTADPAREFQVLNVATLTTPAIKGYLNTERLYGMVYDAARDRAYGVGSDNTLEFIVFKPTEIVTNIKVLNAIHDGPIYTTSPGTNYGSYTTLFVTFGSRSLVRFDVSSIPTGSQIVDAKLSLYTDWSANFATPVTVHRILPANANWQESSTTWNYLNTNTSTSWAGSAGLSTANVDYTSTAEDSLVGTFIAGNRYIWNIGTSVVQNWITNPTQNAGLVLRTTTGNWYTFASSEYGSDTQPQLTVEYIKP